MIYMIIHDDIPFPIFSWPIYILITSWVQPIFGPKPSKTAPCPRKVVLSLGARG